MRDLGFAAVVAVFLWWLGTGVVLRLDRMPSATFRRTMLLSSLATAGALLGLAMLRDNLSVGAAYGSFTLALVVWAWSETTFLTGLVTGRQRGPCPPEASAWRRFGHGVDALAHHEIAIAVGAIAIAATCWDAPNRIGLWTYLALWALRTSAKLNLFLGVRNTGVEMLPAHLDYLSSLFGRRPMNPLMPVSILAGLLAAGFVVAGAVEPDASSFERTGLSLLGALILLGVLEHLLMLAPIRSSVLWKGFGNVSRGNAAR
ncbi:MAG: putative photosynthetic complex assembly protein PuhE [Lautropia sp.]